MSVARRLGLAVLAMSTVTACEFDQRAVAPTTPRAIVHGVLNPNTSTYTILVEELLTGRVNIDTDIPFRDSDPIRTGGGVPISGALVVITNSAGESATGVEDQQPAGGTGVYRFLFSSGRVAGSNMPIFPGSTYSLRVTTPSGAVVTGSTTIPVGVWTGSELQTQFDRDRDTMRLAWSGTQGQKTYLVRVNTPRGPYHIFTDSANIRLPGDLRDFFSEELPSVFVPGFTQMIQVSAIDLNLYDYYRSRNNPFTGSGLINRLQGGIGVFGSLMPVRNFTVETVAVQDMPVEGAYLGSPGFASAAPRTMTLYEDARNGRIAVITGHYDRQTTNRRAGVLGFLNGSEISLAFLREDLANDTLSTYSGTLYGRDSIVGQIRATGERIVYRKQ